MYAKAAFVRASATLPQAALLRDDIVWLDLGCHEPSESESHPRAGTPRRGRAPAHGGCTSAPSGSCSLRRPLRACAPDGRRRLYLPTDAPAPAACTSPSPPAVCSAAMKGTCVDMPAWARRDRVRISQPLTVDDGLYDLTPVQFTRAHRAVFAGCLWGMGRTHARRLMDVFFDTIQWMLARDDVDYDQTVFWHAFRNNRDYLEPVPVFGDRWHDVVRHWMNGPPDDGSVTYDVF